MEIEARVTERVGRQEDLCPALKMSRPSLRFSLLSRGKAACIRFGST